MNFNSSEYDKYVAYIAALDEKLKPKTLRFRGLPFLPDKKQAIFVEKGFKATANCYILQNHRSLLDRFQRCGYDFLYTPVLGLRFMEDDYTAYYRPFDKTKSFSAIRSNFLNKFLVDKEQTVMPSVIIFDGMNIDGNKVEDWFGELRMSADKSPVTDKSAVEYVFTQYELCTDTMSDVRDYLNNLLERLGTTYTPNSCSAVRGLDSSGEMFAATGTVIDYPDIKYEADDFFETDVKDLIREVREKVEQLRQKGVNDYVLRQILQPELKLSRMFISESGRIYLLDYGTGRNGLEIQMHTLDKAVFFLFLRHPEGIIFKELPTYSDELYAIYYRLCNGTKTVAEMRTSVEDVTNPFSNSINEKCSRIRQAFIREFDDSLASHYYIYGKRGEAKKIALDRSLVTDRFAK